MDSQNGKKSGYDGEMPTVQPQVGTLQQIMNQKIPLLRQLAGYGLDVRSITLLLLVLFLSVSYLVPKPLETLTISLLVGFSALTLLPPIETIQKVCEQVKQKVWEQPNPKKKSKPLSPAQKALAKARAKKAGRPYPNLVDNMAASRKKK
jgi:hypothetical protein